MKGKNVPKLQRCHRSSIWLVVLSKQIEPQRMSRIIRGEEEKKKNKAGLISRSDSERCCWKRPVSKKARTFACPRDLGRNGMYHAGLQSFWPPPKFSDAHCPQMKRCSECHRPGLSKEGWVMHLPHSWASWAAHDRSWESHICVPNASLRDCPGRPWSEEVKRCSDRPASPSWLLLSDICLLKQEGQKCISLP